MGLKAELPRARVVRRKRSAGICGTKGLVPEARIARFPMTGIWRGTLRRRVREEVRPNRGRHRRTAVR